MTLTYKLLILSILIGVGIGHAYAESDQICIGNGCPHDNVTYTVYLGFVKPTVANDGCGSSWNPHCVAPSSIRSSMPNVTYIAVQPNTHGLHRLYVLDSEGCQDWRDFALWSWMFKC